MDDQNSTPPPQDPADLESVVAAYAETESVQLFATRIGSTASFAARTSEAVLPLLVAALHRCRRDEDRAALTVVVDDDDGARDLAGAVAAFAPCTPVGYLPGRGVEWGSGLEPPPHLVGERARALGVLAEGGIVAASATALVEYLPDPARRPPAIALARGEAHDRDALVQALVAIGYERVHGAIDERGQVAVRGDVLDVFPSTGREPLRVEFFGDEIERLARFSPLTQRSLGDVDTATVNPAGDGDRGDLPEVIGEEGPRIPEGLTRLPPELLAAGPVLVWDRPAVAEAARERIAEAHGPAKRAYLREDELDMTLDGFDRLDLMPGQQAFSFEGHPPALAARGLAEVERALDGLLRRDLRVVLAFPHAADVARAQHQLRRVETRILEAGDALPAEAELLLVVAPLRRGLVAPDQRIAVIPGAPLFRTRRSPAVKGGRTIASFGDLRPGDYVVHEDHGVGRFERFETRTVSGVTRDYLDVAFRGEDRLYLPHEQIGKLTRYIGADGREPQLSKLGGKAWLQLKARARTAVREMAGALIALYARRETAPGIRHGEPGEMLAQVERAFPYAETDDQERAIDEVMEDLATDRPMDRLICGDVGFGKTEVALRAAVRVVEGGRQVLLLAPTTILAQQHAATFRDRLRDLPVRIEAASRLRSDKATRDAIAAFGRGEVEILIGTHRLLSRDVAPADLGLVIVDEEQRFGVAQKELLRQMRTEVDVLALSATPIPRTLHMSLSGLRDISVIATPPRGRRPIRTHVGEFDEELVAQALRREIARGGQAFYLHNRVETIEEAAARLQSLCPELRFGVGHGQMTEKQLDAAMRGFLEGDVDVLVATTIIESGLDIPSANTLIIERADLLGLSQLYQIRGRVGRSDQTAHAYLFYPDAGELSEEARARLAALADSSELGAGFRVAMRDLELRGAGNLLGDEQSGHVAAVGFELYCDLLAEAVGELQGAEVLASAAAVRVDAQVDAYVPADYVDLEAAKMDIHRRIALAHEVGELRDLAAELADRFGPVPEPVANLIDLQEVRLVAAPLGNVAIALDRETIRVRGARPSAGELERLRALEPDLRVIAARDEIAVPVGESGTPVRRGVDFAAAIIETRSGSPVA